MKVLVIEDYRPPKSILPTLLKTDSVITKASTGEEGFYYATNFAYDIVVLDTALRDIAGIELIHEIRKSRANVPILAVSEVGDPHEIAKTLDAGADRYLVKGFHQEELLALMTAVVRRSHGYSDSIIVVDDLVVDVRSKKVRVQGKPVHLPYGKYRVLEVLALHKGELLSERQIYELVYDEEADWNLNVINVFVCLIRRSPSVASGGKKYIETVRGVGYILRDT